MSMIISESTLLHGLETIRTAIHSFKDQQTQNVVFMNIDSFYHYIHNNLQYHGADLEMLLTSVEPYIPLTLSDENLRSFLDAALSNDVEAIQTLEDSFVNTSKTRFINAVYNANNDAEWDEIVGICKTIRSYKEQGYSSFTPSL